MRPRAAPRLSPALAEQAMPSDNQLPSGTNRLILEVRSGSHAYRKAVLVAGQALRVGQAEPAGFVIPDDKVLEPEHFELSWDGTTGYLRDLGSKGGTLLGGQYVWSESVPHGSWLRAGRTDFSVYVEAFTPPPTLEAPELESLLLCRRRALEQLREQPSPLFMLLDAARDERIRVLLRESIEEYCSLYAGPEGDALAEVAPYLVRLPPDCRLIEALVGEGWGKSWGVFLRCDLTLDEVRRHFRHFLMVEDPRGRPLYFRFYDPRVLGEFISTCTIEDARCFCGPIHSFWMEGRTPEVLLRFHSYAQGIWQECFKLDELRPTPIRIGSDFLGERA
jgi:pSer/pThr/pTyr-binding forkhead associated (FHA) protein